MQKKWFCFVHHQLSSLQIWETSLTWRLLQDLFHIRAVSTDWKNELEETLLLLSGGSLHGSAYLPLLVNWNFIHIYAAWHLTSIWLMVSHFCDWLYTLTSQWNVYKLMEDLLPGYKVHLCHKPKTENWVSYSRFDSFQGHCGF